VVWWAPPPPPPHTHTREPGACHIVEHGWMTQTITFVGFTRTIGITRSTRHRTTQVQHTTSQGITAHHTSTQHTSPHHSLAQALTHPHHSHSQGVREWGRNIGRTFDAASAVAKMMQMQVCNHPRPSVSTPRAFDQALFPLLFNAYRSRVSYVAGLRVIY
jgi:hypothetical protein